MLNQAASCGDHWYTCVFIHSFLICLLICLFVSIKVHDMSELKEVYAIIDIEEDKGIKFLAGFVEIEDKCINMYAC